MARNKVDTCMICGCAPCECFAPAKKEPKPKVVKPKPAPEPEPVQPIAQEVGGGEGSLMVPEPAKKLSFKDAMKARAAAAPPPPPPPPPAPAPVKRRPNINEADALLAAGIRALGPLLSHECKQEWHHILSTEPSLEERRVVWKARARGLDQEA